MTPIKDLGAIGWAADQEPYELPENALSSIRNIRFSNGYAERAGGHRQVFTSTSVVPYYVQAHATNAQNYIVHAGLSAVYVDDGSNRTDITGAAPTGTQADRWTGGTMAGNLILNNGKDVPMYWDGNTANNLATLTDWTATERCYSIRPFKQYLVAMRITKGSTVYPHMVKWSHVADPGAIPTSWDETDATKDAGETDLAETPDKLVDGLALGDVFCLYKERSIFGMQYTGGPFVFRFFRMPGEVGMLARGCAAQTPAGHVVLTQGDVIVHNGQGPQSILEGKVRRWLFANMDADNAHLSFVVAHPQKQEVWVCFPEVGQTSCTKALTWNWQDGTIGLRDLPNLHYAAFGVANASTATDTWATTSGTWDSDTGLWSDGADIFVNQQRLFGATADSKIVCFEAGDTFDGTSFDAYVERTGIHLNNASQRKLLRAAWPKIDGTVGNTVTIQLGASETPEASPTWGPAQTYTIGSTARISTTAAGRYLAYRIQSNGTAAWRVRSIDFDVVGLGTF